MSDLATPTASRLTRPSLRDSRLIVGVLLVLASTVLGAVLFARAGQTVPHLHLHVLGGRPLGGDFA